MNESDLPTAVRMAETPGRLAGLAGRPAFIRALLGVAVVAALAWIPAVSSPYVLKIGTEVLIYGILAMSVDFLLGYTGLPSLGHAGFYAVGAYTAGVLARKLSPQVLLTLPAAVVAGALVAVVIGALVLRSRGIYFLMLTLAFGQMIYAIVYRWNAVTGGPDGLAGVPRPRLGMLRFDEAGRFYLLALAIFLLVYIVLQRLVQSPFGRALTGVRGNEQRMRALGYDTYRLKLAAFVISGAAAGAAGALGAHLNRFVSPGDADWTVSALYLVMVIIGGAGTLVGPVFGALFFLVLQNALASYSEYWHLYLGVLFMAVVLALPGGLAGAWRDVVRYWQRGRVG